MQEKPAFFRNIKGDLSGALSAAIITLPMSMMIPLAAIAGIIISVGIGLFDRWSLNLVGKLIRTTGKLPEAKGALLVTLLVTVLTVTANLIIAISLGFAVTTVLFVSRMGRSVIRRKYCGSQMTSKKIRPVELAGVLHDHGKRISVFELYGPIFFGSAETLANEIEFCTAEATYLILDMKRVNEIDTTGAKILICKNLDKPELEILKGRLKKKTYRKGEMVALEGKPDRDLLFLTKGAVSIGICLSESDRLKRLATCSPGAVFGEVELLDGQPRSADGWADSDSEILHLTPEEFEERSFAMQSLRLLVAIAGIVFLGGCASKTREFCYQQFYFLPQYDMNHPVRSCL